MFFHLYFFYIFCLEDTVIAHIHDVKCVYLQCARYILVNCFFITNSVLMVFRVSIIGLMNLKIYTTSPFLECATCMVQDM
jgi:hypothetical protein